MRGYVKLADRGQLSISGGRRSTSGSRHSRTWALPELPPDKPYTPRYAPRTWAAVRLDHTGGTTLAVVLAWSNDSATLTRLAQDGFSTCTYEVRHRTEVVLTTTGKAGK